MVPLSVTETEMGALVVNTKNVIFYRMLLTEWGFFQNEPTVRMEDCQPVIAVTSNLSRGTKKLRHNMRQINFIMQSTKDGVHKLIKIAGEDQTSDALTKALAPKPLWRHMTGLQGAHTSVEEARRRVGQHVVIMISGVGIMKKIEDDDIVVT